MKELLKAIKSDKEIEQLKKQYYEIFGVHRPYSIWEDGGIEDYKDRLKRSIKERKQY